MERPPPHSVDAIRAKRVGGKKVPKKYRKHHESEKRKKQGKGKLEGFTKGLLWIVKELRGAFDSLR
ncbi:hypothetical protein GQ44DRAFT_620864 [Phaeosphaeriaceae sp. PMI808]|nr:hypothetical protein GQ44DRAFT_620864 [Phaeosphaeriaceae sp. PMI808]